MGRRNGENYGTSLRVSNISHEVQHMLLPLSIWAAAPIVQTEPYGLAAEVPCCCLLENSCPVLLSPWHIWNTKWKMFMSCNKEKVNQLLSKSGDISNDNWILFYFLSHIL